MKNKKRIISPYLKILLSFFIIILIGSFLLMLPFATKTKENLTFIDAFFTSVSAVCVTGLSVISDLGATLSAFGKIVMMILIEIGGLSILTIAMFLFVIIGRKLNVNNRYMMKEVLNQDKLSETIPLIKRIVLISFTIQLVGAIINTIILLPLYHNFIKALGIGVFHAVSSFNNAGFDLFGSDSLISLSGNVPLCLNTSILITLGGIGFMVISDILSKRSIRKLNVYSKIVLLTSFILVVSGTLLIKFSLWSNISWFDALNASVSSRTAGFANFEMTNLPNSTKIIFLILMFIGASPISTGGGVKTTTLFVIFLAIVSFAKDKKARIGYKSLSNKTISKAFSLVSISIIYILFIVLIISFTDPTLTLDTILFEVVSAFGTVGLSLGITSKLSVIARLLICLTMFLGRLGPLTIMNLWNKKWNLNTNDDVRYLEENIIIG